MGSAGRVRVERFRTDNYATSTYRISLLPKGPTAPHVIGQLVLGDEVPYTVKTLERVLKELLEVVAVYGTGVAAMGEKKGQEGRWVVRFVTPDKRCVKEFALAW